MARGRTAVATTALAIAGALVALACGSFGASDEGPGPAPPADGGAPGSDATSAADVTSDGPPGGCNGLCPKTILATSQVPVPWLALDTTRVIWMTGGPEGGSNGDLYACAKGGCAGGQPKTLASTFPGGYLTSDGTTAFVGGSFQSQGLRRLDGDILQTVVPSKNGIYAMVARGTELYFASFLEADGAALSRTIYRVPIGSTSLAYVGTYVPLGAINTSSMAVSQGRVFLGSHSSGDILACDIESCVFSTLATGDAAFGFSMATDDLRVFWTNNDSLVSCGVNEVSCIPRVELPPSAGTPVIVVRREGALFVTTQAGDLIECASTDCANTAKVIAHEDAFDDANAISGKNVAVDATSVYYVAHVGAEYRVMRLSRNGQ